MTLEGDLEVDCCEEELSEAQANFYSNAAKEYEKAMLEVTKLRKGSAITKTGNVWLVKSTYHVKLQNKSSLPIPAQQPKPAPNVVTIPAGQKTPNTYPAAFGTKAIPSPAVFAPPAPTHIFKTMQPVASPAVDSFPASQLLSKFSTNKQPAKSIIPPTSPVKQTAPQITVLTHTNPITKASEIQQISIKMPQNGQQSVPTPATMLPKKVDDPKSKPIPSLSVVVRPANAAAENVNQKKREALDAFVKSRLVLDARRFAEWLMQVGLLRSQQYAICKYHSQHTITSLQLRMYAEESRFPHSGGYVWITKCCDRNFVSIFRDSIFEDATHPPTMLLKLIYHWACQTTVSNVTQWVKVDHLFLRSFYSMLRSACTVEVHTSTPVFGASIKNGRVEIGVISLGTTSSDGKRRDVKVEVLGVYDQETQKIRLRASEPIVGDSRSRSRFAKILEPLSKWVSTKAIILTDYTVDRVALQELGFQNVVQKTLNNSMTNDQLNNRNIMDYLRKTVPKVFQNTLSLLSTATIQQFLDELVWRETNGQTSSDAFHNIIRDLSAQARAETGMPLIKRLPIVSLDPFKDWSIDCIREAKASAAADATPIVSTVGIKRPAPPSKDVGPSAAKEARNSSYYATMFDPKREVIREDSKNMDILCQHSDCRKSNKNNLEMMAHVRQHLIKDVGAAESNGWSEQCIYCLETLPSVAQRKLHEDTYHTYMSSFKSGATREDSAVVKEVVCLICHEKFGIYRQLEQHLEKSHVYCEMPYRCRGCNFQTSVHSHLVDHFYQSHKNSSHLLCPLCLDTFPTKDDNKEKGMATGHMQYLQHLKAHLSVPVANRHRCQRCVLTFLQYEQLRYHVRTDHNSALKNSSARPFTFTVIKPPTGLGRPTLAAAGSMLISPTSGRPVGSPLGKTGIKTYTKEPVEEQLPNTNVARRFPNLTITDETTADVCIECKEPVKKKNHFTGYLCCTMCRYSTCCNAAMKEHQNLHNAPKTPTLGPVFALKPEVKCKCGYVGRGGLEMERHIGRCGQNSVTISS